MSHEVQAGHLLLDTNFTMGTPRGRKPLGSVILVSMSILGAAAPSLPHVHSL